MATEAARLRGKDSIDKKNKTALTNTGLLMEGIESTWRVVGPVPSSYFPEFRSFDLPPTRNLRCAAHGRY